MSPQHAWAKALLEPRSVPSGLNTWNRSDPLHRLAVHRNNVIVSLVDALAQTFPVTRQLVGEDFFRAMARVFVRAQPPRTRVLAAYGETLPDFVAGFTPAAALPYLPDVARLEWLHLQALHAADATPLGPAQLACLLQDTDALAHLRWQLAPSLHLLRSAHAAVSLWAAHQEDSGMHIGQVDTTRAESALVFRSGLDVIVQPLLAGADAFFARLLAGARWADAASETFAAEPDFDLTAALTLLVRHELLTGARIED